MFKTIRKSIRQTLEKVLNAGFILSNILIPLGVVSFYFTTTSMLLPEGVNQVFASRSSKYILPITIFLFIAYYSFIGLRKIKQQFSSDSDDKLVTGDLVLLLYPLTPVLQYMIFNAEILSWYEHIAIFCVFMIFVSIPILVVPLLFKNTGSTRILMSLGLAFTFSFTNMASLTSQLSWHKEGSLKIQLLVLGSVWLISFLLIKLNLRRFMYLLTVVYFSTNSIYQLIDRPDTQITADPNLTENKLIALIDSREPVITPSIYLLVYDAYVVNETMQAYGIDNQLQEQYLEDKNFILYPQTYSIGGESISSMSRVLNSSTSYDGYPRKAVSGDGIVQNTLEIFGYKTYGIFPIDFFFRGVIPSYNYSFPSSSSSLSTMMKAIFLGEFRFGVDFDKVPREQYIHEKHTSFSEDVTDPKFIYTHSKFPGHSQNSGVCGPNEFEMYKEKLTTANEEMRQDVELIIENDPNAIIIIAGDHGPYITKNCRGLGYDYNTSEISRLDIQDRFGTFLAIRWPTADFEEYDEITILQDIFPAIFAYMFADPGILESQVEPIVIDSTNILGGALVNDGMIKGGIHDGEALFLQSSQVNPEN